MTVAGLLRHLVEMPSRTSSQASMCQEQCRLLPLHTTAAVCFRTFWPAYTAADEFWSQTPDGFTCHASFCPHTAHVCRHIAHPETFKLHLPHQRCWRRKTATKRRWPFEAIRYHSPPRSCQPSATKVDQHQDYTWQLKLDQYQYEPQVLEPNKQLGQVRQYQQGPSWCNWTSTKTNSKCWSMNHSLFCSLFVWLVVYYWSIIHSFVLCIVGSVYCSSIIHYSSLICCSLLFINYSLFFTYLLQFICVVNSYYFLWICIYFIYCL